MKEKEIHFIPTDMSLTWIEYDEKGNLKDCGKSQYQIYYNNYDEFQNFYNSKNSK